MGIPISGRDMLQELLKVHPGCPRVKARGSYCILRTKDQIIKRNMNKSTYFTPSLKLLNQAREVVVLVPSYEGSKIIHDPALCCV